MRKTILLFLVGLSSLVSVAQTEKKIKSEIKNVTVYQEGAEITRQAKIHLQKGKTVLLFSGLSAKLDVSSIQAKGDNELMIVSISHGFDYLNQAKVSAETAQLEKKKLSIKDSLALVDGFLKVYQQEKEMILANKAIGGDNGVNVEELKSAASFFRNRLMEIEHKAKELERQNFNLKNRFIEISKQLLELNFKSDKPASEIKVVVSAQRAMEYTVDLKYIVAEAGWEPDYDLRITDVNQPLSLFYKAKVFQNTDEDWENVKLILSTGNPNISNDKPELSTYYLTFDNYYKKQSAPAIRHNKPFNGVVVGKITDSKTGEPLIGAMVLVKGSETGTVTDFNGEYKLNVLSGKDILVFESIGYKKVERYADSGRLDVALVENQDVLEEIVVVGYGSKSNHQEEHEINRNKKKEHVPLAIEQRQTSTEFEIKIPYSIPSDNKPYDVTMVEYQVDVDYHYSAVPKLSNYAYLTAKIPDWTKYKMISGKASLFFQGIYQGETYLDLQGFDDTLSVSIGRDMDISISREIQKDYSKKTIFGSNKKEIKSWEITIKNNKNSTIELVLEDQFPISKDSDIKVEQIESSGAEVNEDDGKLTWKLKLDAKEKKVLIVKYEVKYPKNRNLIVD